MRKITIAILIAILPGLALAQTPRPRPLTGDVGADIKNAINPGGASASPSSPASNAAIDAIMKPFKDIAEFVGNDVAAAAQLAVAVPELQDGTGLACWNTMQAAGKVFKAHPVPITLHAATDLQGLRLVVMAVNRLCDDPNCTVVFSDGINIVQAASPVTLPPLPSLSTLCSKVAHIKLSVPSQADLDLLKAATAAPTPSTPAQP